MQLNRRHFLNALATATATLACPSLTFAQEKSGLKITSV
ncbi:MAG: twin-arginine translocation signal domain-containing protein, partial [Acidobacteriia bacterium]|nr:twin-arginine translocation signal domain-containing protein [Terriglobia bacterium]